MKRALIYLLFAGTLFLFASSCGEEKKEKITGPIIIEDKDLFSLKLTAIVKEDDSFDVFYVQNENEKFTGKQIITTKVTGSDLEQDIYFKLPEGDYPYNLRLDLGVNKNQIDVTIIDLTMQYSDDKYKIIGKDLYKHFNFQDVLQMSPDSTKYKVSLKDKHDPFITGNDGFKVILNSKI
ncbi:hypothetical protein [Winogradskyella ludwigii]|jgi:hypothetical protein|uniref:hypothetical protein n=1 Tax=Winogradskyella ludwigii TaxID=2686076 RepID=UPI0015CCE87F|nr:hypothetical protein [Winogradskyella ludwigii]